MKNTCQLSNLNTYLANNPGKASKILQILNFLITSENPIVNASLDPTITHTTMIFYFGDGKLARTEITSTALNPNKERRLSRYLEKPSGLSAH